MRTRRPTLAAGKSPRSIQLRTVCWLSFNNSATSATVRNSFPMLAIATSAVGASMFIVSMVKADDAAVARMAADQNVTPLRGRRRERIVAGGEQLRGEEIASMDGHGARTELIGRAEPSLSGDVLHNTESLVHSALPDPQPDKRPGRG